MNVSLWLPQPILNVNVAKHEQLSGHPLELPILTPHPHGLQFGLPKEFDL